jgi:hypothetical protein
VYLQAASGIPLTCLLILGLPHDNVAANFSLYLFVVLLFGVTISWCGTGCNSPLFAEIVPPQRRSLIYAFDRCFEGAIAACAAPFVGLIAEHFFGYNSARALNKGASGMAHDPSNAAALGNSLVFCLCVPWSLCFLIYFCLYATYPAERARLKVSGSENGTTIH